MITVEYKDFEEMKSVAREILGLSQTGGQLQVAPATGQPPVVPTAALISGQSCQQGPAAPVSGAPTVPVVPVTAAPLAQAPQQTVVPTSVPEYKLDDLARAAMALMDAGRQAELQQLLAQFGVESLPALDQARYGAFATALRGMGAPI